MAQIDIEDELKRLAELVTRCDERIRSLSESQRAFERRDESVESKLHDIKSELKDFEKKVDKISEKIKRSDGFWEMIFDGAWKVALAVIGAWIVYKLNIKG